MTISEGVKEGDRELFFLMIPSTHSLSFFISLNLLVSPSQCPGGEYGASRGGCGRCAHRHRCLYSSCDGVWEVSSTWVHFSTCKCISVLGNHWAFFISYIIAYADGFLPLLLLRTLLDANGARWSSLSSLKPQFRVANDNADWRMQIYTSRFTAVCMKNNTIINK